MSVADLYFGPITLYITNEDHFDYFHRRNLRLYLNCLRPGVTIFLRKTFYKIFFDHIYGLIQVPFVLITGGISNRRITKLAKHDKGYTLVRDELQ